MIKKYLTARLKEASTWKGIISFACGIGLINFTDAQADAVALAAASVVGGDVNSTTTDPKFTLTGTGAYQYQLQEDSPAIGAGVTTDYTDYDFRGRPVGDTVDIGAFQTFRSGGEQRGVTIGR